MKPFMNAKEASRKQAARAKACNPAPNRPPKHYQRINRALDLIAERVSAFLSATQYAYLEWLPFHGLVHARDDEWQHDLYAQVHPDDHKPDFDGFLSAWSDPGIKATNRIEVITWYENPKTSDAFIIKKPILSPLPCDAWGRLPITLVQWRRVVQSLIASEIYWRWTHAVRQYTDNPGMNFMGLAGWNLDMTQAVTSMDKLVRQGKGYMIDMRPQNEREQDASKWIGANICLDITAGFSLDD